MAFQFEGGQRVAEKDGGRTGRVAKQLSTIEGGISYPFYMVNWHDRTISKIGEHNLRRAHFAVVVFRTNGREHIEHDQNCAGCESVEGEPRLHRDRVISCFGLVHVETVGDISKKEGVEIAYYCEMCGPISE